jgi:uncharacterized protein YciI
MAEIIIDQLVPNEETGEAVWTPFIFTVSAETDFVIDPENLDGEICGIGPLLNQYGDMHSKLQAQSERHKRNLEAVSARLFLSKKQELTDAGEKAPIDVIKAHVTNDPEYQAAVDQYVETQRNAIRADGWWKSVLKKADLVQALAYKINSEIKRGAY